MPFTEAELLKPDYWPSHSPDLNPMDYSIWSSLATKVFKVKIRDVLYICAKDLPWYGNRYPRKKWIKLSNRSEKGSGPALMQKENVLNIN